MKFVQMIIYTAQSIRKLLSPERLLLLSKYTRQCPQFRLTEDAGRTFGVQRNRFIARWCSGKTTVTNVPLFPLFSVLCANVWRSVLSWFRSPEMINTVSFHGPSVTFCTVISKIAHDENYFLVPPPDFAPSTSQCLSVIFIRDIPPT